MIGEANADGRLAQKSMSSRSGARHFPKLAESAVGEYVGGDNADAPDLMTLRTSQVSQ